ncbi:MAG TPA: hypothetical protein VFO05_07315 [Candidatus Limnocylindrales bacterium]|nr:hypothetical protein [Candidatus Limnocylindrales bacterium]
MSKRKARPVKPLGRGRVHRLADGRRIEVFEGPRVGDGVVTADLETVLAALEGFDPEMSWKKARQRVLPMLPRVRPLPAPQLELVRAMLPPGILVGFGIDIGPAITFVTTTLIERWRIEPAALAAAALANLREIARCCNPHDVLDDHIGDIPVSVVQTGQGIASSMLLVPDCLERMLGVGDRFLLAPMRDILIALPSNVDRSFAAWLADEWESLDPNHLHLGGFRYGGGRVVPESIDEALARA